MNECLSVSDLKFTREVKKNLKKVKKKNLSFSTTQLPSAVLGRAKDLPYWKLRCRKKVIWETTKVISTCCPVTLFVELRGLNGRQVGR